MFLSSRLNFACISWLLKVQTYFVRLLLACPLFFIFDEIFYLLTTLVLKNFYFCSETFSFIRLLCSEKLSMTRSKTALCTVWIRHFLLFYDRLLGPTKIYPTLVISKRVVKKMEKKCFKIFYEAVIFYLPFFFT